MANDVQPPRWNFKRGLVALIVVGVLQVAIFGALTRIAHLGTVPATLITVVLALTLTGWLLRWPSTGAAPATGR
jgi:hypothetical protein